MGTTEMADYSTPPIPFDLQWRVPTLFITVVALAILVLVTRIGARACTSSSADMQVIAAPESTGPAAMVRGWRLPVRLISSGRVPMNFLVG